MNRLSFVPYNNKTLKLAFRSYSGTPGDAANPTDQQTQNQRIPKKSEQSQENKSVDTENQQTPQKNFSNENKSQAMEEAIKELDLQNMPMPDKTRKALNLIMELNFKELIFLGRALQKMTGFDLQRAVAERQKALQQLYNMSAAAFASGAMQQPVQPQAQSAPATPEAGKPPEKPAEKPAEKPVEAKSIATVKLVSFPEGAKFNVLREVRKLKPGMNLMDSKKLVENLPQILVKSAPAKEVEEWKKALEAVGAVIELI